MGVHKGVHMGVQKGGGGSRFCTDPKEAVFLGVILDENMSWKSHTESHTENKISKSIGVIFKASFCLPLVSLCILYYSMIYPYLQ